METRRQIAYIAPQVTVHSIVTEGILCDSTHGFDILQGTENIGNSDFIEL